MPIPAYTISTLPQRIGGGQSTGRHVEHDFRSLFYARRTEHLPLVSAKHEAHIPVLNQANIGSCTGQSMVGALGRDPFFATLPEGLVLNENLGLVLYSEATRLDGVPGTYLPTDTGSTGLGVGKATVRRSLISGYQHTFSADAALRALGQSPVLVGIEWWESFDDVAPSGEIVLDMTSKFGGGHQIVADEVDVERRRVWYTNTWTDAWGLDGRCWMSFDTFEAILARQGDVLVPVPLSEPAPEPSAPVPPAPVPPPPPAPSEGDPVGPVSPFPVSPPPAPEGPSIHPPSPDRPDRPTPDLRAFWGDVAGLAQRYGLK